MSELKPFTELLSAIVDNRGRTCPTTEEGIPLIATNCINNDALYPTYEKARYVSQATYDAWFRGHPEPGDIIFVTKGSPGRVCMAPDPIDFCIAQDMVAVRPDPNKVYPKYLFAALRSYQVQQAIGNMHVGTLIPHFKKGDFDKLSIPVPETGVQEVIGDMYFSLSAKIEQNRHTNETLEAMAQAIFNSWFVDFDPVRAKASELVRENALEIGDGYRAKNDELGDEGLPFIRAMNLKNSFDTTGADRLKPDCMAGALSKCSRVGDVAFTSKGTIGRFARVGEATEAFVYSPQVCYWRTLDSERLHPAILYCWMQSDDFLTQLHGRSGQTDMAPYVSLRDQRGMFIPRFDASQAEVGRKIAPLLDLVSENQAESHTLSILRDTLLPKLLSGELS